MPVCTQGGSFIQLQALLCQREGHIPGRRLAPLGGGDLHREAAAAPILILTSNLGSEYLLNGITDNGEISEEARSQVEQLLKRSFRPEFLNRLDEIVFYKPLTKENIVKIIDLQMDALNARLADKQLRCELTPEAKQFIIDAAYDPQYGARPLRRYLQHTVETLLARRIVEGNVSPGATLRVEVRDDALQVV